MRNENIPKYCNKPLIINNDIDSAILFFSYLGILTTEHTFEDCRLMMKARELNLPFESGLIGYENIKTMLKLVIILF